MAILDKPWDKDRVYGLKGILDFYTWKGIPVVRKWPNTNYSSLTPATKAQWPIFGYISQAWNKIDVSVADAYTEMSLHTQRLPRDYQLEVFYNKTVYFDNA